MLEDTTPLGMVFHVLFQILFVVIGLGIGVLVEFGLEVPWRPGSATLPCSITAAATRFSATFFRSLRPHRRSRCRAGDRLTAIDFAHRRNLSASASVQEKRGIAADHGG